MGCCLGKEKLSETGSGRFSPGQLVTVSTTLPDGGELSGSGGESSSPGDKDSEARERFTAYYGSEDTSIRELRRGIIKFNQSCRQVRPLLAPVRTALDLQLSPPPLPPPLLLLLLLLLLNQ
jgi:hypothetical protein